MKDRGPSQRIAEAPPVTSYVGPYGPRIGPPGPPGPPGPLPSNVRSLLLADVTLFIDAAGSDANDGTQAAPWATI